MFFFLLSTTEILLYTFISLENEFSVKSNLSSSVNTYSLRIFTLQILEFSAFIFSILICFWNTILGNRGKLGLNKY